jgi:hypothetical protein
MNDKKQKWTVILKAEVEAHSVAEAREKAIGSLGNFNNCKINRLEFIRKRR